jgi:mRNA degradation ribonuclease J1/J2
MSATAIPGNERAVIDMINEFVRKGVDVLQNSDMDIHAS